MTASADGETDPYRPSARSIRQSKGGRTIPAIGGAGAGLVGLHNLGPVGGLVCLVVAVALALLLVRVLESADRKRMSAIERGGALLAGWAWINLDEASRMVDLNHRSPSQIASGAAVGGVPVAGLLTATQTAFHFAPTKQYAKRGRRAFDCEWKAVRSAELRAGPRRSTFVFLSSAAGERWRLRVQAPLDRVRTVLAQVGVPGGAEAGKPETPVLAPGDSVRLPDERSGHIVAVVPRDHDPGAAEVLVRDDEGIVDSWDITEVRKA